MKTDYNIFTSESFFKRIKNVFIPTIKEIITIKKKMDIINKDINNKVISKDEFFSAIHIIYKILNNYIEFKAVYNTNNELMDCSKSYTEFPKELIKNYNDYLSELKIDDSIDKAEVNKIKNTIDSLKNESIYDLLYKLEEQINYRNYKFNIDINAMKNISLNLNKFNNLEYEHKCKTLTKFCTNNFEKNKNLNEFIELYKALFQYDLALKELLYEIPWITKWFEDNNLKEISKSDPELYFKIINIINSVINFDKTNKDIEDCEMLLNNIKKFI